MNPELKLTIDNESVNIYLDKGELSDPIHVLYWHIDEVEEDPKVAFIIATAVNLYHTNPEELLKFIPK